MIILGLDPGTTRLGYGIIKTGTGGTKYLSCGVIEPGVKDRTERLKFLHTGLIKLIKEYKPDAAVVEKLYFSNNKTTALSVAEARGVILLTLAIYNISITEFTPNEVKKMVAGWGRSDKHGVELAVKISLSLPKDFKVLDDATDALALALSGSFMNKTYS